MQLEQQAVLREYSTKPVRVTLARRRYVIPANYFGPKEGPRSNIFNADKIGYFGFSLFLPDFGGYTQENWRDKFDHRLIKVIEVHAVDKNRPPANYGEPSARFQNAKLLLEATPSLQYHGLSGYRPKHGRAMVTWTGTRSNGEFFFFTCHLAPGDSPKPGTYPFCDVRYYSEAEQLYVSYRYSNDQLEKWREIDDAIWAKLHAWEGK